MPVTFVAVPAEAPRWIIQATGCNLNPVLSSWSPYRWLSKTKWQCIRLGSRLGALAFLPFSDIVEVELAEIDWRALGWNGSCEPAIVIYIGTPGPARKAIIHLVDRLSGQCELVLKVPLAPGAGKAILREAAALAALAGRQIHCAPSLRSVDRERGTSTQAFVAGRPGGRKLLPSYFDLLCGLNLQHHTTLAQHAEMYAVQALAQVVDEPERKVLNSALDAMSDDRPLQAFWVHGDFAPWNIRARRSQTPALIDWEDSERAGLPLQDAFHFLHMQDFVFQHRPTLHRDELTAFGARLGLEPQLCEKLEIAYLAHSYLRCRAIADSGRASFCLTGLRAAVQQTVHTYHSPRHAAPQMLADGARRSRAELFAALVATFNREAVPYCILSGRENENGSAKSDVDIMVQRQDRDRVPALLVEAGHSAGAVLAQAIRHETSACYFVLARIDGGQLAFLDVDCYTDYQKRGRTWLLANKVIRNRRRYRNFYVPSIADEFTYYTLKKILKQSIAVQQLRRLQHLLARDPAGCGRYISRFLPVQHTSVLRAITSDDIGWLRRKLPELERELLWSRPVESAGRRFSRTLRECIRLLERTVHPTGLWIEVRPGDVRETPQFADALVSRLAPVFRRTRILGPSHSGIIDIAAARARSTLVVSMKKQRRRGYGLVRLRRWCRELFSRFFVRPDVTLQLGTAPDAPVPTGKCTVKPGSMGDVEQLASNACNEILQRLSTRLQVRLRLRDMVSKPANQTQTNVSATKRMELSAAGSD